MLSVIQTLAQDIATLSNRDLNDLARELVRVFSTRAEQLEQMISIQIQELTNEILEELGVGLVED